jgi:hypothetical protein
MDSDTCIPYNTTQTLWRVINDWDMVARVPFTPCTMFNGGAGDETHLLISKGVIKVSTPLPPAPSLLPIPPPPNPPPCRNTIDWAASIDVGLLCNWNWNQNL